MQPEKRPAESVNCLLADIPEWTFVDSDVSEIQTDDSHNVKCKLTFGLTSKEPAIFSPYIVKITLGRVAKFPGFAVVITGKSTDRDAVNVPSCSPEVETRLLLDLLTLMLKQDTDESDLHTVNSQVDSPARVVADCEVNPNPDPCNVAIMEPVATELKDTTELKIEADNDKDSDMLPMLLPAVRLFLLVPLIPLANLQLQVESEIHKLEVACVNPL